MTLCANGLEAGPAFDQNLLLKCLSYQQYRCYRKLRRMARELHAASHADVSALFSLMHDM